MERPRFQKRMDEESEALHSDFRTLALDSSGDSLLRVSMKPQRMFVPPMSGEDGVMRLEDPGRSEV